VCPLRRLPSRPFIVDALYKHLFSYTTFCFTFYDFSMWVKSHFANKGISFCIRYRRTSTRTARMFAVPVPQKLPKQGNVFIKSGPQGGRVPWDAYSSRPTHPLYLYCVLAIKSCLAKALWERKSHPSWGYPSFLQSMQHDTITHPLRLSLQIPYQL